MFILIFCRQRAFPYYQWELFKIEINVVFVTRLVVLKGTFVYMQCNKFNMMVQKGSKSHKIVEGYHFLTLQFVINL